jgi:hypothetical protein
MRRLLCAVIALTLAPMSQGAPVDFSHEIVPLLQKKCAECHSGTKKKGGLSIEDRKAILKGGEDGPAAAPGSSATSAIIKRVTSHDKDEVMPPKGERLTAAEVDLLKRWIDEGMSWQEGFRFGVQRRIAALAPRKVEGSIDSIIDRYLTEHHVPTPELVSDRVFARRAHLDIIGLLPAPEVLESFERDPSTDKRAALVKKLLADNRNYAEHFLTFWNDALRNAYRGTGFIDGGRKQITGWLYKAIYTNKPYDQFVRELVSAAPGAEGFTKGIVWRGVVNASQRPEMQAVQNIGQVFLGTNLKCSSCHDSFVNDWKLEQTYELASAFADEPLEIHRCDKPTGKIAHAAFLYPQLGQIDEKAPKAQRMKRVAELLTNPQNGRLARTMVNRLWAMLMGRGIVETVDDMDQQPWSEDLLDYLAWDFQSHGYDIKRTIELICTSRAYQMAAVGMSDPNDHNFTFRGPVVKRMTAEQFVDAVSMITGVWRKPTGAMLSLDGRAQAGQLVAIAPTLGIATAEKTSENKKTKKPQTAEKVDANAFPRVRASLAENDALMSALGRPHREQVVTHREPIATTLQALEMTNGSTLDQTLREGAAKWVAGSDAATKRRSDEGMVDGIYLAALGRRPSEAERAAAGELIGRPANADGVADLLWSIVMMPEFQLY